MNHLINTFYLFRLLVRYQVSPRKRSAKIFASISAEILPSSSTTETEPRWLGSRPG